MIGLLPIHRIIVAIATTYAAIVAIAVAFVWKFSRAPSLITSLKIAFAGGTALNLLLLIVIYFGWRSIWSWFPRLNVLLFPDLNGSWHMKINWVSVDGSAGIVHASAVIKQDLIHISMEVDSPGSDSETLIAHPRKDPMSGRPILYYVYRVIPKQLISQTGGAYEGAAILKFLNSSTGELRGNYFTSKNTKGYFSLTRT
jgi:hypothetical protein